jgi:hypothetical protein
MLVERAGAKLEVVSRAVGFRYLDHRQNTRASQQ